MAGRVRRRMWAKVFFYLFVCLAVSKKFNCCTFRAFTFIQPLFLLCANRFSDRRVVPWVPEGFFSVVWGEN